MLWKRRCVRHKLRAVNDRTFLKAAEHFRTAGKAADVLLCKPPNFASICRSVRIDCEKQSFFNKFFVRRKVLHRASEKAKKHPFSGALFALAEAARFDNLQYIVFNTLMQPLYIVYFCIMSHFRHKHKKKPLRRAR